MYIPKNEIVDNTVYTDKPARPYPKLGRGETAGFYSQEKIAELRRQVKERDEGHNK